MGRVFKPDQSTLTVLDNTHVSMNAGSAITIGGQQYLLTSPLLINAGTTGIGGLDTGSLAPKKIYLVHGVTVAGVLYLVASLSAVTVVGFPVFSFTGWFFVTDGSGNISYTTRNTFTQRADSNFTSGAGQNLIFGLTFTTPDIPNSLWQADGEIRINEAGVACSFTYTQVVWALADGTGGATPPTPVDIVFGMSSADFGYLSTPTFGGGTWEFISLKAPTIVLAPNKTFYLVPEANYINNGGVNAITGVINMRRFDQ